MSFVEFRNRFKDYIFWHFPLLDRLKEYVYWHFIFPRLDYTKKHFHKVKIGDGTLFIRKKRRKKR